MDDKIRVVIDNIEYSGWKNFNIKRSLNSLCGSFNLEIADLSQDITKALTPGGECEIFIGDDQLISGYIDKRERSLSASDSTLIISGRDKTADLVDCSAIGDSNTWKDIYLRPLIQKICDPFGIFVDGNVINNQKFKTFSVESGETAYEAIERACRQRAVLPITNRFGDLELSSFSSSGPVEAIENLEVGRNVKEVSESIDFSSRFSEYIVKGQDSGDGLPWDTFQLQKQGKARDPQIVRYRPKVIISETKSSTKSVQDRAAWEAQVTAGRSFSYTVLVQGFRQNVEGSDKPLWQLADRVNLKHTPWDIDKAFLISDISYSSGSSGKNVNMILVDPNTYYSLPSSEVSI